MTFRRMLESLAGAKAGSFTKLVEAAQQPESMPDPARLRALLLNCRALIFIAHRARRQTSDKLGDAMSPTCSASYVWVLLDRGTTQLSERDFPPAKMDAILHRVTIFAAVSDIYMGRLSNPGADFDKELVLRSFEAFARLIFDGLRLPLGIHGAANAIIPFVELAHCKDDIAAGFRSDLSDLQKVALAGCVFVPSTR